MIKSIEGSTCNNDFEEYKFVREEIRFQHTLLGYRLGLFLNSQVFLCTAYSISIANDIDCLSGMLSFVGLILAFLMHFGVKTAKDRLKQWREKEKEYKELSVFIPASKEIHNKSLWFPTYAPWIFLFFWLILVIKITIYYITG